MAVKNEQSIQRYIGLAADSKPTSVKAGSTYLAYDTGILYVTHDGTNWVVKDGLNAQALFSVGTGSVSVAIAVTPLYNFRLLSTTAHFGAAPSSSGDFTLTLDSGTGTAYDTLLFKHDPKDGGITDMIKTFGEGYEFASGDHIDIVYANPNSVSYGIRTTYEII